MSIGAPSLERPIRQSFENGVALLSAYSWLMTYEPWMLDLLLDPVVELEGDTMKAAEKARELNAPSGVVSLAAKGFDGAVFRTFPAYIWTIVYAI